jgi:putative transposase
MPRRVYSEINLHITWHTKLNTPLIEPEIEAALFSYLKDKVIETPDALFHAVGGTETHVHLAVSVLPTLNIAEWVGRLKGGSSHYINNKIANRKALDWQEGYGVVSFGTKDLKWVVRYVENQKEHHAKGKTFERLERIEKLED